MNNESITAQLVEKKGEMARYQAALSNKEAEAVDLMQQMQALQKQQAMEVQKLGEVIASEKRSKEQLQKQLDEEQGRVADLHQQLSSSNAHFEQKMASWLQEKSVLENRMLEYDIALQQSQSKVSELTDDLKKAAMNNESITAQLVEKKGEMARYQAALSNKEAEAVDLMQQMQALQKQQAMEVQKLGEAIASEKRSKEQLQKQLDEEQGRVADLHQQLSSSNAHFEQKMASWLQEKSVLENRMLEYDIALQQSQSKVSELTDDLKKAAMNNESITAQLVEKKGEMARYQAALSNKEAEAVDLMQQMQALQKQQAMEVQKLGEVIASEKRSKEQLQKQLDEEQFQSSLFLQKNLSLESEIKSLKVSFDLQISVFQAALMESNSDFSDKFNRLLTEDSELRSRIQQLTERLAQQDSLLLDQSDRSSSIVSDKDQEIARYQAVIANKDAEASYLAQQVIDCEQKYAAETIELREVISVERKATDQIRTQLNEERAKATDLLDQLLRINAEFEQRSTKLLGEKEVLESNVLALTDELSKVSSRGGKDSSSFLLKDRDDEIAKCRAALNNKEAELQQMMALHREQASEMQRLSEIIAAASQSKEN
jgi:chromosome segregation ATPase